MASLADLQAVPRRDFGVPEGVRLAELSLESALASSNAAIQKQRLLRNFSQFDLPQLASTQAARGAFRSSATQKKSNQLATSVSDLFGDVQFKLAPKVAGAGLNKLIAATGQQVGGY